DKPVDDREYLLHFVSDDVPPHFKRHAINPFTMGWFVISISTLPEKAASRLISKGTKTWQPFSTRRRANCAEAGTPAAKPTSISGVQSASGTATTRANSRLEGCKSKPSACNPPRPTS